MANFTPSGSGGIPVSANIPGVVSPSIVNIDMPLASTEYSYTLPGDTRKYIIKLRDPLSELRVAYSIGGSSTVYFTIPRGNFWSEDELDTSAVVTLYFQSTSAAQTLEIISWV